MKREGIKVFHISNLVIIYDFVGRFHCFIGTLEYLAAKLHLVFKYGSTRISFLLKLTDIKQVFFGVLPKYIRANDM